jgi:integrase
MVEGGRQIKKRLDAKTNAEAVAALNAAKVRRDEGALQVVRHAPKLADAIADYKASAVFTKKRAATQKNESTYFKAWEERLGSMRVDKIHRAEIIKVRDDLLATDRAVGGSTGAVSPRTANLYVLALMQVLKYLEERGKLAEVPRVKRVPPLKAAKRPLLTDTQCGNLLDACADTGICEKNGRLLGNYLRFLLLTGAREREAYRIKWDDVHLDRKVLTIGADGLSKNGKPRTLHMIPELEDLLQAMHQGRQPDSCYIFPSPQRGEKDIPVRSLRESLLKVRKAVGLESLGFHDFRHLFISKCVMAGVDYMTIAEWVGHQDGGVLIGKVYGHLNDQHKAAMAERLAFFDRPAAVADRPMRAARRVAGDCLSPFHPRTKPASSEK